MSLSGTTRSGRHFRGGSTQVNTSQTRFGSVGLTLNRSSSAQVSVRNEW